MGENSGIEWTHHTFNPWWGCAKVSPGCDHCYAESWANRTGWPDLWGTHAEMALRRTFDGDDSKQHWREPFRWNKKAEAAGVRERVFCASMADVFDNHRAVPEERERLWDVIHKTPHLDWLLLTKRIGNVKRMLPAAWLTKMPRNVWLGISVVNQEEADRDIPRLFEIPAAVRFLSCEPLLGPIDLEYPPSIWPDGPPRCCSGIDCGCQGKPVDPPLIWGIHWVIVGGESGHHARPLNELWAHGIRNDCAVHRVPFFFKQGSQANWPTFKDFASFPPELQVRQWPSP